MSTAVDTGTAGTASTGLITLGRLRTGVELKNLWRSRQAFGFTIAFPVMMLLLFGSIFTGTIENTGVEISQVYVAGIMGSTFMSTAFVSLAIGIAIERESGMLKRLAGTPMPPAAYFLGKIGMVLSTVIVQVAVLLAMGVAFFHVDLPTSARSWGIFVAVFLLGVTASTLLGIAVGSWIKDSKSGPAVVNLPFVALQFISGVWINVDMLPTWLQKTSQVFPLHWICRGIRQALLPDAFKIVETGGSWQLTTGLLVLAGWCVVGFAVCAKSFRWTRG